MKLPIFAYGQPVLRKVADDINKDYPDLKELLENMWDTMYNAHGVGLAAPQIGLPIRLFLVDSAQLDEEDDEQAGEGIRKVFINAQIEEEDGEPWSYEEGCLSIPDIRESVERPEWIKIRYLDENFEEHVEEYDGLNARIIQHEYDHIDGVLFLDYLGPLKKRMLKKKLDNISRGRIDVNYKMRFPIR